MATRAGVLALLLATLATAAAEVVGAGAGAMVSPVAVSVSGPNAACTNEVFKVPIGDYSCTGANTQNVVTTWVFPNDTNLMVDATLTGYSDSRLFLYSDNDRTLTVVPNSEQKGWFFDKGRQLKVVYQSGASWHSSYGPRFKVYKAPAMSTVVSGQTFTVTQVQSGGFVYFLLPRQEQGRFLTTEMEIKSYQGLQEPAVFMSLYEVPTLENHDYTNVTIHSGGKETCLINVPNPNPGAWVIGVFMFGTAAEISVKATWQFKSDFLVSGVKVSMQLAAGNVKYYQIYAPVGASKLVFQLSRQLPGGFPIAYIAQGITPSAKQYEYVCDTKLQSYFSISIAKPNPAKSTAANPGYWMIAIAAQDGAEAGFIVQADLTK